MPKIWKDGKVIVVDSLPAWPEPEPNGQHAPVQPGVYELPSGEIFVVKPNQERTRVYASRLVETPSDRVTEAGGHVKFEFKYAPGAIYQIRPDYRMPADRARELMIRYGRCIVCGRHLKVAESVERGIGPICIKYFAPERRNEVHA